MSQQQQTHQHRSTRRDREPNPTQQQPSHQPAPVTQPIQQAGIPIMVPVAIEAAFARSSDGVNSRLISFTMERSAPSVSELEVNVTVSDFEYMVVEGARVLAEDAGSPQMATKYLLNMLGLITYRLMVMGVDPKRIEDAQLGIAGAMISAGEPLVPPASAPANTGDQTTPPSTNGQG